MQSLGRLTRGLCATSRAGARAAGQAPRAGSSGSVDKPNVPKLAEMARIKLTEQEVADYTPKIESIVEWFGELAGVDVEGVPPALRACDSDSKLREDVAVDYEGKAALLKAAPSTDGPYIRVPKITNESAE